MAIKAFVKDPDAQLDYTVEWANFLEDGETIATAIFVVPAGLSQPFLSAHDDDTATVWISGGVLGQKYLVTCRVTTTNDPPRTQDASFRLIIQET